MTSAAVATEAALAGGPLSAGSSSATCAGFIASDAGQVDQHEHAGRDAEEPVHVEDVLDAERPGQRPDAGGEHGGADEAGEGEQARDVRELAPQRLGREVASRTPTGATKTAAKNAIHPSTHDTLSHGRGP